MMKTLSSLKSGASMEVLRNFYIAYVRSKVIYGSENFSDTTRGTLKKLNVIKNTCLRLMNGARKTTPILTLEAETGVPPLNLYFQLI